MANKINFQKELDKLLEQHQREARVPFSFSAQLLCTRAAVT